MVKNLFELQREFILCSTGASFNDASDLSNRHLASPIGSGPAQAAKMREIKTFATRHAYSPHAPHLHFVADTIGQYWILVLRAGRVQFGILEGDPIAYLTL